MTSHVFCPFLTYLPTLSYSITSNFGAIMDPLATLLSDVINGHSLIVIHYKFVSKSREKRMFLHNCFKPMVSALRFWQRK